SAPEVASAVSCAAYASSEAIAWAKIVGFVVTPTTDRVSMRRASDPDSRRVRERSSSHTDTPAAERRARAGFCWPCWSWSVCVPGIMPPRGQRPARGARPRGQRATRPHRRRGAGRGPGAAGPAGPDRSACRSSCLPADSGQRVARGRGDGLGGEAELLEEDGTGGGRPVVLERDGPAVRAQPAVPALRDAGLDAHPGADR